MGNNDKPRESKRNKSYDNVIMAKVRGCSIWLGALVLGWGVPEMIAGHSYAPYLIAIGLMATSLIVITDEAVRWHISTIIKHKKLRYIAYSVFCLLLTLIPFFLARSYTNNQADILSKNPVFYGELTPSNEPDPPSPTLKYFAAAGGIVPKDCFRVMLGDDSGIYIKSPVNNALYFTDKSFLTISTGTDGVVYLSANITDSNNHNIARIIKNEFQANPEYAFNPRQPDRHTLIVRDSSGVTVLNIKYINPHTIWISDKFLGGDSQYITVNPSGLLEISQLLKHDIIISNVYGGIFPSGLKIDLSYREHGMFWQEGVQ